jgi:hypothetical protein
MKALIIVAICSLASFTQFEMKKDSSDLPLFLTVLVNGVKNKNEDYKLVKKIFTNKKIKVINEDDINRHMQNQFTAVNTKVLKSNGQLNLQEEYRKIGSQKPFAFKLDLFIHQKSALPDSISLNITTIPRKGKTVEAHSFINSRKDATEPFLSSCIDSCIKLGCFLAR